MRKRNRSKIYQASHEEDKINLTPLIDVIFVILVMFILIAPMINIDRIELADGAPSIQQSKMDQTITIQIRSDKTYLYNQKVVSLKELSSLLVDAKKRYPNAIPQIMPDKNASFQSYENVRTATKNAGFEYIDVNLKSS